VLTFPAYFSYPLEALIEPRTEFLKLRRRPIAVVGLNTALTSGDADFAKKVAKVVYCILYNIRKLYMYVKMMYSTVIVCVYGQTHACMQAACTI
jgi:hypothetical protein